MISSPASRGGGPGRSLQESQAGGYSHPPADSHAQLAATSLLSADPSDEAHVEEEATGKSALELVLRGES